MDAPEARAIRAATGMARSARSDPSRGTKIRFNMIGLLSRYILSSLWPFSSSLLCSLDANQKEASQQHILLSNKSIYRPAHRSITKKRISITVVTQKTYPPLLG